MQHLQIGSTLQSGKYKIIKVLGQGGFGITYLAENTMLDGKMAIKEFFFKEYCDREESTGHVTIPTSGNREIVERFRQKFIKEARTIFKLNHPNIVGIHDIFEENGTAYYVMDYIEGESLGDMVKRRGAIPESEAVEYIKEVAKALSYIHNKKMTHLDIKPGNIMKSKEDGKILVIDFGVAKQYDVVTEKGTTTTPVGISAGYSPSEQYEKNGVSDFSPQSDVYALAATLYKLLTDITPPEAMEVSDDGLPVGELQAKGISQSVISAIVAAMQTRKKRTQSVDAFVANLDDKNGDSENTSSIDDEEATRLTLENQRMEEERKRKEAEAKAAKEKAEAEARAKAEAERKAKEEAERKAREAEERSSTKMWIVIILVVAIVLGGIITKTSKSVGDNGISASSSSNSQQQEISSLTFTANGVSFDMMKVKGGTFTMGSTNGEDDEKPTHQVTLSDYSIGKTEVTQALWKAVMGKTVSQIASENNWGTYGVGDNYPMYDISYNDCKSFISKLNSITGKNFRMPTEAEWEFAARGGNNSKGTQYSGSNNLDDVAWYWKNSGDKYLDGTDNDWDYDKVMNNHCKTHPVAQKQANELGLYDMSGNVWEWCSDWYSSYSSSSQTNPTGASSGSNFVYRGGSWFSFAGRCRSSRRGYGFPDKYYFNLGLRLCLSE